MQSKFKSLIWHDPKEDIYILVLVYFSSSNTVVKVPI
jgi:hypothetical protein